MATTPKTCRPILPVLLYRMSFVKPRNYKMQSCQWYRVKRTKTSFANKGNCGKRFGHLFIISSSSHFFNKTDFEQLSLEVWVQYSGGFRGGDGGDASPPTSLKVMILAEKSASILNNSAPFRDASPPTDLNVTNPAAKSVSILVKTFFFFWRPPDIGRKKRLNFRFRPKNHSQFW